MGLLYEIIMQDIKFLERLKRYLKSRGARQKTFFYFLATLNNISVHDPEVDNIILWLKHEKLLDSNFTLRRDE